MASDEAGPRDRRAWAEAGPILRPPPSEFLLGWLCWSEGRPGVREGQSQHRCALSQHGQSGGRSRATLPFPSSMRKLGAKRRKGETPSRGSGCPAPQAAWHPGDQMPTPPLAGLITASDKLRVSGALAGIWLEGRGSTLRSGRCLCCPSPEIKKELDRLVSEGRGLKGPRGRKGPPTFPSQGPRLWHHRAGCGAGSSLAGPSAGRLGPLRPQESSASCPRGGLCRRSPSARNPSLGGGCLRGREGASMGKAFLLSRGRGRRFQPGGLRCFV